MLSLRVQEGCCGGEGLGFGEKKDAATMSRTTASFQFVISRHHGSLELKIAEMMDSPELEKKESDRRE